MSGFKRKQSKVFWNYMASQDLAQTPYRFRSDPEEVGAGLQLDPRSICFEDRDSPDESDASDDVREDKNITIIRVETNAISDRHDSIPIRPILEEETEDNENVTTVEDRSIKKRSSREEEEDDYQKLRASSPTRRSHRSQDSGFSDSERSDCGEMSDTTPRSRRRRRIKPRERRHKRDVDRRLGALWKEGDVPPIPAHTSTPNQHSAIVKRRGNRGSPERQTKPGRILFDRNRAEDGRTEDILAASFSSLQSDECLGDFLYASEPPEDAVDTPYAHLPRNCESSVGNHRQEGGIARQTSSIRSGEISGSDRQLSAVRAWLNDIAMEAECECTATLQSKALPRRKVTDSISEETQSRDLKMLTSVATAAATKLLVRAENFDKLYRHVFDRVTHSENGYFEKTLLRSLEEEAFSVLSELGAPPPRRIHQSNLRGILAQLDSLKDEVDMTLNARLDFYIERVVRGLEEAPTEGGSAARGALAALTALGLAGSRAGTSIARCSGVRALLTSLISAGRLSSDLRAASLRALASVCCCPAAIESFVRDGGPEILVDLLANEGSPETEKMEAAALVVQITASWTDALGLPHLEPFKDTLVPSLVRLAEGTTCGQTMLLAAAALNHLVRSRKFVAPVLRCDAVRKLLRCVKKSIGGNVWLMEQVAAFVGELARIPEVRPHLAEARASVALVCFLRMRPPGLENAYQRLEITAADALTRLCVDPEVAKQVVAVGGANCLPDCNQIDDAPADGKDRRSARLSRYTRSLRVACRKAAKQIHAARAYDYRTRG